jgi:uncharacterized protein
MRYKTKDIGEAGLDVRVPVTADWLAAQAPDLDARPGDAGITLTGRLEPTGDDSYLLRGDIKGSLVTPCGRCLEPALVPIDVPVTVSYVERDDRADDEDDDADAAGEGDGGDVLSFTGGEIDLGPELRDETLLAVPMGPLCRPDCKGICSICGGNRNAAACDCEEKQRLATSKLSALKNLKI